MKIQTTKKAIEGAYSKIICVGYCNIQYLLQGQEPIFYTCGVYGWNSDIYKVNNRMVICTGYRPFGNIRPDYDLQQKYENKARKIYLDYNTPYQKRIAKINKLLDEFLVETQKQYEGVR